VIDHDIEHIKCLTGANPTPSNETSYLGQHGLRRKYFNTTTQLLLTNITQSTEFIESLAMDLETPNNIRDNFSGYIFSGYFKAPATANYRFYVSVDDEAEFFLSNISGSPANMTRIFRSPGYSGYRGYLRTDGSRVT
jgi:PA14 domain